MNRATKRLLARQQAQESRRERVARPQPGVAPGEKRKRTPPRQFLREVRTELRKVAWPTRSEVATYTVVVLISVIFVTLLVFALDFGFAKSILKVFKE
jgi:preprotein translocase subunit SecE